jgi:hypothetical protein
MQRPKIVWILIFFLVFLGLGGLYGGFSMLIDPSGELLQMSDILQFLPVSTFILPGLFLVFVMGLSPLFLAYALLTRPQWIWAKRIARDCGYYWAWTGTLALGVILMIWLFVQGLLIGFKWPIQYVTAGNGILIILLSLMPGVRKYCKIA